MGKGENSKIGDFSLKIESSHTVWVCAPILTQIGHFPTLEARPQEVLRLTRRICSCGRLNRNCSCGRLNRNCSCGRLTRNWNSNLWKFNCGICNFGRLFFLTQAWPRSSYEKKTPSKNRKETPKLKRAFCLKKY